MKISYLCIALLILCISLSSCNQKKDEVSHKEEIHKEFNSDKVDYIELSTLKKGMSYNEIEKKYNKPIDNIGSGNNILVYLSDQETMAFLYFDSNNNLLKVETIKANSEDEPTIVME